MFQMSPASPLPPLLAPLPAAPGHKSVRNDAINIHWLVVLAVPILKNDGVKVNGKDDIP